MTDFDGRVRTSRQINHDRIGGFHIDSAVLSVNHISEHCHDFEELVCILDGLSLIHISTRAIPPNKIRKATPRRRRS